MFAVGSSDVVKVQNGIARNTEDCMGRSGGSIADSDDATSLWLLYVQSHFDLRFLHIDRGTKFSRDRSGENLGNRLNNNRNCFQSFYSASA